jgi:hypothetical protein
MNEKCFMTSCKNLYKKEEIRKQHEFTHRRNFERMSIRPGPILAIYQR